MGESSFDDARDAGKAVGQREAPKRAEGRVDVRPWLYDFCPNCGVRGCTPSLRSDGAEVFALCGAFVFDTPGPAVDWVITGGETDQGKARARPSNPQWFRDVRDACRATGALYHHKQNGEWVSVSEVEGAGAHFTFPDGRTVRRVGRAKSGRTIDGAVHDSRPDL